MSEGLSSQLPFLLLMLVVFFFFIILPGQRKQKKEKNFMSAMKKGDRIITKSGLHAKIMELNDKDNTCVIETLAGKLQNIEHNQKLPRRWV